MSGFIYCCIYIQKKISEILKGILSKKYGKAKAAGSIFVSIFALWFWLAVFYRTDIGMPIGVQNYLYHKYGEEFDVNGFFGATIAGHPTNQLTCCPKNGNPATDSFNVVRKNTLSIGSRRFASDNYYGIIIRDDYEKYISTYIDDYFDDFSVHVYFDFSGLSNTKYMSDEFDKNTSLEEFLDFQLNEDNIRACNFATVIIELKYQPTIEEKDTIIQNANNVFNDLINKYRYLGLFIQSPSKYNISALITHNGELLTYNVDDKFFKLEEE